jgi:Putative zinc-finger
MVISCEQVWRNVSDYLDGEVDAALRAAIEEHVRGCKRCTSVLEGMRNVVQLYGDERMLEVPLGFSRRLHQRLENDLSPSRRSFLGWAVAAAASILVAGAVEVARSTVSKRQSLRSEHARTSNRVPPDMMVIVAEDGKIFHVAGCPFIHDKTRLRTLRAQDAEQEGYTPCVRCMKKYLEATASSRQGHRSNELG